MGSGTTLVREAMTLSAHLCPQKPYFQMFYRKNYASVIFQWLTTGSASTC
jgi:hypothetical protein